MEIDDKGCTPVCSMSGLCIYVLHSSVCGTSGHVLSSRMVLQHADPPSVRRSYGGAGALWHIWPRDSRPGMERFLRRHAAEFAREGCSVDPKDILHPIHDQVRPLCQHCTLVYTDAHLLSENQLLHSLGQASCASISYPLGSRVSMHILLGLRPSAT